MVIMCNAFLSTSLLSTASVSLQMQGSGVESSRVEMGGGRIFLVLLCVGFFNSSSSSVCVVVVEKERERERERSLSRTAEVENSLVDTPPTCKACFVVLVRPSHFPGADANRLTGWTWRDSS